MVLFRRNPRSPMMTQTKNTPRPRKTYDDQFKRDAVKLLAQPGYTLARASAALGVSQASLSQWKRTLLPRESADLAAQNAQLIKRVRELEMERDILKKAATYFARESR
jgi:transposase